MKLIYLKSKLKCDSFGVTIGIKIPFCRVLVTIEPDRSLLQFVTMNWLRSLFTVMQLILTTKGVQVLKFLATLVSVPYFLYL